jgi:DNA polymerase
VAPATDDTIAALDALREEVECCSGCALGPTRTKAVFGEGDPGADLMFVGEAPGYHEDQQGRPFVGQAGRLLEQLLASIGMTREQVYIANVLKSRPPNNRDPRPEEIEACRPYLFRQIEIIKPKVICTLGNFATKLLTGDPTGITRVHGQPRATEIAGHPLYLYPIFHPAAALYTPAMRATLEEDIARLPQLLAHAAPVPGEEEPAAERPAWRPPEHLRRDVAPAGPAAPPAAEAPETPPAFAGAALSQAAPPAASAAVVEPMPPAAAEPTLEELARDTLGATPVDEDAASVATTQLDAAPPGSGVSVPASDPAPRAPADADSAPATEHPAPATPGGAPAEAEQLGLF